MRQASDSQETKTFTITSLIWALVITYLNVKSDFGGNSLTATWIITYSNCVSGLGVDAARPEKTSLTGSWT